MSTIALFHCHCRVRFGQVLFLLNLLTYIGYLACLTAYVLVLLQEFPDKKGCLEYLNDTDDLDSNLPSSQHNYTGKRLLVYRHLRLL